MSGATPLQTQTMHLSQKEMREKCWEGRDSYFTCLEKKENNAEKCKEELLAFEDVCSAVWVKHFISKRDQDMKKARFNRRISELKQSG